MILYSLSTSIAGGAPRAEALDRIARSGFQRVELICDDGHLDSWTRDPAGLRRDLAAAGLQPASLHLPGSACNLGSPSREARAVAIEAAIVAFRQAAEVGVGDYAAGAVICHPNTPNTTFTVEDYGQGLARARESMAELARLAETLGLRLALENLPARHQPRPGTTVADVLAIIEGLGDHVGVCVDAGHANANGLSAADEVRLAGERLFVLHIQDNDGLGEDQHLLPGEGTTDWDAFVAALAELRFAGLRTFEINSRAFEDNLAAVAALRRRWEAREG